MAFHSATAGSAFVASTMDLTCGTADKSPAILPRNPIIVVTVSSAIDRLFPLKKLPPLATSSFVEAQPLSHDLRAALLAGRHDLRSAVVGAVHDLVHERGLERVLGVEAGQLARVAHDLGARRARHKQQELLF